MKDFADLAWLDIDMDEFAIAFVDGDVTGMTVRKAAADADDQIRLEQDLVADRLPDLNPGMPGV